VNAAGGLMHALGILRHFLACFGALATGFRAGFAMVRAVLLALLCAVLTDVGAEGAKLQCVVLGGGTAAGHKGSGHAADVRAEAIDLDALGHHGHIGLV